MRVIINLSAQGDIVFWRVKAIPADAIAQSVTNDRAVVAHSETGHDHVAHGPGLAFFESKDPLICYLRCEGPIGVSHLRDDHPHEMHSLEAGSWQGIRQREYSPLRNRRVED